MSGASCRGGVLWPGTLRQLKTRRVRLPAAKKLGHQEGDDESPKTGAPAPCQRGRESDDEGDEETEQRREGVRLRERRGSSRSLVVQNEGIGGCHQRHPSA